MILASSLALDAEVTCTGSHAVTAADVNNLERDSSASVTAVDGYMTEIQDERTVTVGLDQVTLRWRSTICLLCVHTHSHVHVWLRLSLQRCDVLDEVTRGSNVRGHCARMAG